MLSKNSSSYLKRSAVQFCKLYKFQYSWTVDKINIKPAPFTHFYFHFNGTRCKIFNYLEFDCNFEFEANTFAEIINKMIIHNLISINDNDVKKAFKKSPAAQLI